MITWMQRHKRWLVITIWISTIAFVGAGFVGWGSYSYGSKSGVVATIGDREIKFEELNQEYSSLYNQYSQLFGSSFNQEIAKQLRLEDIALSQLLQKRLIMAYGEDLGLKSTEEEVVKEILKYEDFKIDGKFSKEQYIKVLTQNRITPAQFELSLRDAALFQKIQALFTMNVSENSLKNIGKLLFVEDDIEYKILSLNDISVKIDEEKAKEFFEKNRMKYNSQRAYELDIKKLNVKNGTSSEDDIKKYYDRFKSDYKFEDGKLKTFEEARAEVIENLDESNSKKEALTLYMKLKKGEINFDSSKTFSENKLPFLAENIDNVTSLKDGEIGKPFLDNGSFYIVKMIKNIAPKPLSFEEAKTTIYKDALNEERYKLLKEKANSDLSTFKGKVYKNINRESIKAFKDLNENEAQELLSALFITTTKESFVELEDKIVLYRVLDSKFKELSNEDLDLVKPEIESLIENEILVNLLKKLELKYEIKTYMQNKE
ncbi:Peptidyl-prolyl cis-trans isomerase D [Aliarcobacter thereius]|uniref:peptidylprolyl isomerase n=1 Tax=Aliarcobacter thereius TaxID=544718 RepID=UPI000827554B|nr:peptidylprolyl isomerase [Aliarcobacter thereius]OCL86024.1 Peptidyl-prolyl cis-trans isomerase D [Aliarcobacter thereius]TLT06676.1 peptidylprolyl isomerase [Aliarcobacter thereius]